MYGEAWEDWMEFIVHNLHFLVDTSVLWYFWMSPARKSGWLIYGEVFFLVFLPHTLARIDSLIQPSNLN